jgi:hypothetical protein
MKLRTSFVSARLSWAGACLLLLGAVACGDGGDNFNDNSKNTTWWGADDTDGNGVMTEAGQRLRYTCPTGTLEDKASRPWNHTRFPYNADWEILIDAFNTSSPVPPFQVNSMGITLESPLSADDYLYHEFYNSALGGPSRIGTNADLVSDDVSQGGGDSSTLATNAVRLRMTWNSTAKVLTCTYDIDPADADVWVHLASFGLSAAGGGAEANADWGLADSDRFFISVYGYSAVMTVTAGQMALDNFSETGGVAGGGVRPEPVGSFSFPFPVGNALLTRIASLTGNYQGTSPTAAQRSYNLDIAQDESGKVMVMGTIEGLADKDGDTDLESNVGTVKTVNEEPVARLKGSFQGTVDGATTTYKGSATVPVELVDIGGTNGLTGSGTYRAKLGGVPLAGANVPLELATSPASESNLKTAWTLQLELAAKTIQGKERIVASAVLELPNGDSIQFAERVVKYSEKKGYKLAFKKGMNVTANPDVLDKKTAVILSGLKFVKNGDVWEPSGGTITYRFLGQKGVENLLDFLAP